MIPSRFWPPVYKLLPLWYYQKYLQFPLLLINTTPTSQHIVLSSIGGSFLSTMASNSFSSLRENSQNQEANGVSNQIGPFKGQSPYVPQPLGSLGGPITHTLFNPAISHLPPGLPSPSGLPSPGHLQVDSSNKGSKYLVSSGSLPNLGESLMKWDTYYPYLKSPLGVAQEMGDQKEMGD